MLSTRFRLARNLSDFPFPKFASPEHRYKVVNRVDQAVRSVFESWRTVRAEEMNFELRHVLFEKHLISPHMREEPTATLLVLSPEAKFAILVNEEDHLRFQLLLPGLSLTDGLPHLLQVEENLDPWLLYARHPQYGYITACVTNVGTGLRASVMLHVPGLAAAGLLDQLIAGWGDHWIEFRGMFGEGSSFREGFLQVSNRITLGADAHTITRRVLESAKSLVEQELRARQIQLEMYPVQMEDFVHRSLGALLTARTMTTAEATNHLSNVRLGACLGILKKVQPQVVLPLLVGIRPGHLQMYHGSPLDPAGRDYWRAAFLREQIKQFVELD